MKANELRIGNYVNEEYGGIYEVININSEVLDYVDLRKPTFKAIGRFDINSIKPIQLTEELLLKCGFEYKNPFGYRMKQGCYLKDCLDIKGYYFRWKGQTLAIVDSLHSLQNIFFALTNQELKIIL